MVEECLVYFGHILKFQISNIKIPDLEYVNSDLMCGGGSPIKTKKKSKNELFRRLCSSRCPERAESRDWRLPYGEAIYRSVVGGLEGAGSEAGGAWSPSGGRAFFFSSSSSFVSLCWVLV